MPVWDPFGWFPSALVSGLFAAAFLTWWLTEALYLPRGTDSRRQLRDRGSRLVNVASVYASVVLSFFVRWMGWGEINMLAQSIGVAMMVSGIVLRAWAIYVLGRHFSVRVAIQVEHQLVTNGPYRWLRHPAYTGTLLTLMGLPVALGSAPMAAVVGILFVAAHVYRIRVEEAAMFEKFGDVYREYCSRTWRLFPGY